MKSDDAPEGVVFQSGDIVLYQGDCLDIMTQLEPGSIDLVLCDPPYGITKNKWDSVIDLDQMWEKLERLTYDRSAIVLCAGQPFTSVLITSNLKIFKQGLVWKKNIASNFLNANRMHLLRHEDICVFYKKQCLYNKQLSSGSAYKRKRKRSADDTGSCYGSINKRIDSVSTGSRNPISVLEFDRETGFHPTQKPVALMEYLIKTYSNPGDTVLDFTMGSGTTGVACKNLGRKFIGIEIDPGYFQIAKDRILEAATPETCQGNPDGKAAS